MAKFAVGDEVIVSEEVYGCRYGYNDEMKSLIGQTVHVAKVIESYKYHGTYAPKYLIEEDNMIWSWCDKCFEIESEPLEDWSADELMAAIGQEVIM